MTVEVTPDPKGGPRRRATVRTVARGATGRYLQARPGLLCAVCGVRRAESAHHILRRSSPYFGDDVDANFCGVCGHGTHGCHGALHGSPYTPEDRPGFRITRDYAARQVGEYIRRRRPDTLLYLGEKLGAEAAADLLGRVYYLDLEVACP